jgi:hypothetical protein
MATGSTVYMFIVTFSKVGNGQLCYGASTPESRPKTNDSQLYFVMFNYLLKPPTCSKLQLKFELTNVR